jgi:hypothetical protein
MSVSNIIHFWTSSTVQYLKIQELNTILRRKVLSPFSDRRRGTQVTDSINQYISADVPPPRDKDRAVSKIMRLIFIFLNNRQSQN